MIELKRAQEPFRFYTRMHLSELTGLKAATLGQLASLIKEVPESAIYNHTHRFLLQHEYLSPEPSNDFAYWVKEVLGEPKLGDRLLRIDTVQYPSLEQLRKRIVATIEAYLKVHLLANVKFAKSGDEFHFIKSISFILSTDYLAYDLLEFGEMLEKVTIDSVYFHVFEARLRLGRKTNDFSNWIENSFGDKELAQEISSLNPYTYTLEELRSKIISLIARKNLY
jgi:hypothetical protein